MRIHGKLLYWMGQTGQLSSYTVSALWESFKGLFRISPLNEELFIPIGPGSKAVVQSGPVEFDKLLGETIII